MVDPIAVAAPLLRAQLPDIPLREGATLMARVASRGEQHAVIVLAGIPVTAQVPPDVQAGATLKLKVHEVTPERVTLQIDPQQPATQPAAVLQAPPPAAAPRAEVAVDAPPPRARPAGGGGGGGAARARAGARRGAGGHGVAGVQLARAGPAGPAAGA